MKTGIFLVLFPNSGVIFAILGIFIAIFGAILIQVSVQYGDRKFLTFLVPTAICLSYFFLISPEVWIFLPASAAFLSVQGMYYYMRKFKESL